MLLEYSWMFREETIEKTAFCKLNSVRGLDKFSH